LELGFLCDLVFSSTPTSYFEEMEEREDIDALQIILLKILSKYVPLFSPHNCQEIFNYIEIFFSVKGKKVRRLSPVQGICQKWRENNATRILPLLF
jgi:hypothetical protein